jgi:phosphoglycerate dehydrogenase-like enzyme
MSTSIAPSRPKAFFFLGQYGQIDALFAPPDLARLQQLVDLYAPPQTAETFREQPQIWAQAEVILATWGCPALTPEMVQAAPRLKVIFHAGGSSKHLATPEVLARNIAISTTYAANAVPVAEFALAHILFGLKSGWQHVTATRRERTYTRLPRAGAFGATVGIISLGIIGQTLVSLLRQTAVHVIAYDPYVNSAQAAELGVEMVTLDDLFCRADVVSLHTPWLKETEGMISGAHLASMKPYSTFINTARGAVVREQEMVEVLQKRPDLVAVLDVTHPEPPAHDSPLYTLPNVVMTPHIAGALGHEALRMGQYAVAEIERYVSGRPLQYALQADRVGILA